AERADGVAFDLLGNLVQRVDLIDLGLAVAEALHDAPHPAGTFAARGALAAGLVLVEIADAADRADYVGRLIHHDDARRAEARAQFLEPVEVHRRVHDLRRRDQRNRGAAGDHCQQVVPPAANAAAMLLDQFLKRDAHRFFDDAGPLDVPANLEELGPLVVLAPEAREPARTAAQDR